MRVWDVSPGYLNRGSLLGEHRELHGLHAIVVNGRRGYSRHPETLRWVRCLSGLAWRHAHLSAEMALRGYADRTPLRAARGRVRWPDAFVTEPADQILLLRHKYAGRSAGRIPLPRDARELWAQHKYSVMARDPEAYRHFGRAVARMRARALPADVSRALIVILREPPAGGRLLNALEHMWGYVRPFATPEHRRRADEGPARLLGAIRELAIRHDEPYLLSSTALGELGVYAARERG